MEMLCTSTEEVSVLSSPSRRQCVLCSTFQLDIIDLSSIGQCLRPIFFIFLNIQLGLTTASVHKFVFVQDSGECFCEVHYSFYLFLSADLLSKYNHRIGL